MSIEWISALASVVVGAILAWLIQKAGTIELLRKLKELIKDRSYITVEEEFLMTRELGTRISRSGFKPDLIIAVHPGGMMISEWLSRVMLGNRTTPVPVRSLYVTQQRDNDNVNTVSVKVQNGSEAFAGIDKCSKVLLVIDVIRGGRTLAACYQFLRDQHFQENNIKTAALIQHEIQPYAEDHPVNFLVISTPKMIHFAWKENKL